MSNWDDPNNPPPPPPQPGWPGQPSYPPPQPPRPQSPPNANGFVLGPLTVADVLDLTFQLLRKCWKKLFVAVLFYSVPVGILSAIAAAARGSHGVGLSGVLSAYDTSGNNVSGVGLAVGAIASLFTLAISIFLKPYVAGTITRLVAAEYLGREISTKQAFSGVKHLYWRFVGAAVLVGLCLIAGFSVGALLLFTPGIAFFVLFSSVTPIIAIEEEQVGNALGRSWALMKRRFWSYLGIRVLMYLIAFIVQLIVEVIPFGLIGIVFYAIGIGALGGIFTAIGSVLASLVAFPIGVIVITLMYFDARVRFEGFDLQMMAARMPSAQQPPYQPPQQ